MLEESKILIDERKIRLITMKLIVLEKENYKTKKYTSPEIVKKIKNQINY